MILITEGNGCVLSFWELSLHGFVEFKDPESWKVVCGVVEIGVFQCWENFPYRFCLQALLRIILSLHSRTPKKEKEKYKRRGGGGEGGGSIWIIDLNFIYLLGNSRLMLMQGWAFNT